MSIIFPSSRKSVADRMKSDVTSSVPGLNAFLRGSWIKALIESMAGRIFDFYFQLSTVLRELFPDTATGAFLKRWGAVRGVTQLAATKAGGLVTFVGVDGTVIPSGTDLKTSDGILCATAISGTISSQTIAITELSRSTSTVTATTASDHNLGSSISVVMSGAIETDYNGEFKITVTALNKFQYTITGEPTTPATGTIIAAYTTLSVEVETNDAGIAGNLGNGEILSLLVPISGVTDNIIVQFSEIGGGTDKESDTAFRNRILDAYRYPVANFNSSAIKKKAKEINGVTRVFVEDATPLAGQVTVYFTRDNDASLIPSASEVTDVKNKVLEIKPANTADIDVIVSAPTAVTVNFTFTFVSPDTPTMRTAIFNNLDAFFRDSTVVGDNVLEVAYNSAIHNTVDLENGQLLQSFALSSPSGDITISSDEIAILGTVTF